MTRDGEISAIFNPRRVRAPSVVVTGDSPNGGQFSGFTNLISSGYPHLIHSDSIASGHPDADLVCQQQQQTPLTGADGTGGTPTPTGDGGQPGGGTTTLLQIQPPSTSSNACKESCCSELAQKMYFGVCVTILVTASWVGATHCIKFLYIRRSNYAQPDVTAINPNATIFPLYITSKQTTLMTAFNAPFFASWFCTNFVIFFFPVYVIGRISVRKCESPSEILGDVLRGLRDRGFTVGKYIYMKEGLGESPWRFY